MLKLSYALVRPYIILFGIFLLYFMSGKFGLMLAYIHPSASSIWPPTGIAIALFMIYGYRFWPAIFLGALLFNLSILGSFITSLGIALGNTLEGLVAVYLVKKYAKGIHAFERPRDIALFALLAGGVSTLISATTGVTSLALGNLVAWPTYPIVWLTWWLGDMGGALIYAPVLLLWYQNREVHYKKSQILELFLFSISFLTLCFIVFKNILPFPYLITAIMLWIAFRFGSRDTATAILVLAVYGEMATLRGNGPFFVGSTDLNHALILLQLFLVIISTTTLSIAAEVSERKRAQQSLSDREHRFRALVEKSTDAVTLVDISGGILYVSPSIQRILGYTQAEFEGTNGFTYVHPDDIPVAQKILGEVIEKPSTIASIELRLKNHGGDWIWIEAIVRNLLHDRTVNAVVVNFREITERKELEMAKNEFLMIAAHELRSPLAAMRWSMELIFSSQEKIPPGIADKIERLYRNNQDMIILVNEILDVSRIIQGDIPNAPQPISLETVIHKEVTGMHGFAKSHDVTLRAVIPKKKFPTLYIDLKRITGVIQNLLSNAIKYNTPQGSVTITLSTNKKHVRITVADSGIGIPVKEQDKLFTKFFRTSNAISRNTEGTGLGLFIVKSYVIGWGGTITVRSPTIPDSDRGTTMEISLPLTLQVKRERKHS